MKINPLTYLVFAALILAGLFLIFKPKASQTPGNLPVSETAATASSSIIGNIKTFELKIQGKQLISGPASIAVNQDDEITIKINSDEKEELHIHGYDKSVELEPNKDATITFTAKISGRFPFELETSKTELGAIEVQPK